MLKAGQSEKISRVVRQQWGVFTKLPQTGFLLKVDNVEMNWKPKSQGLVEKRLQRSLARV